VKKLIALLLIFSCLNLYSEEAVAEPYKADEFSPVLHDIRRASIIFCGAFPLGYMYSSIIMDPVFNSSGVYNDLDEIEKNNKEIETKLISSLIFSGLIMFIDFIIEKVFRR